MKRNLTTKHVNKSSGKIKMQGMQLILLFLLLPVLANGGNGWPPVWDIPQTNATWDPHFAIVRLEANPRINEIALDQGDYIGGFYTDDFGELRCGGAKVWNDTTQILIKLYADDPDTPEKDGFGYAEIIYYKFFSWTTTKDYDVDVVSYDNPGPVPPNKWYPIGISQIINMQALVDMDFYIHTSENPICIGSQLQLTAEEFVGTGGSYTFDWVSDPPGFLSDLQAPPPFFPTETTTFILTVDDGNFTSYHELLVTVNEQALAHAGTDGTICSNESFQLNGSASNYITIIWSTSGDGIFSNIASLNAIYTPGFQDIQTGTATIALFAIPLTPCEVAATDTMELQVLPPPGVDPGDDRTVCTDEPILLDADAQNYGAISWTTSGDGVFTDPNALATQYLPGPNDILDGETTVGVCANATAPCELTACADFSITFAPKPGCNAPNSRTKCENLPVPMAGTASNNNGILWTTQGDGYFIDSSLINTNYIPGPTDIANGGTTVTLHALPIAPCSNPATKDVLIIIKPMAEVDAGNDITTCDNAELSGLAADYASFFWTSEGDGYFSNPSILNPVYYPGEQDISMQSVDLTLTAQPIFPCSVAVADTLTLFINVAKIAEDNVADKTLGLGDSLVFVFSAQSIIQGEYSWYFNSELMEGQGSSTLVIDTLTPFDAGYYQAQYSNDCGELESNMALVEIIENYTQQNVLPQGWSGISSFVVPDTAAIEDMFSEIVDDLIIVLDDAGHIFWPDQNINTMKDWSVTSGYKIKMENSAVLNIDGLIRYPIQDLLIPSGWSFLPINTSCAIEVEVFFAQIPGIMAIMEMAGSGIYWPDQNINTLQMLYPGKAYHVLNSGNPITLRFPACNPPAKDYKKDYHKTHSP